MGNKILQCILILIGLVQSPVFFAQVIQSSLLEQVTIDDGLSQGYISNILQDSDGFMWFGTLGGLNRYDGYNFRVYQFSPDDTHSLSGNNISALYEDQEGLLWIGTSGQGISVLNRATEQIYRIEGTGAVYDQLAQLHVNKFVQDSQGNLWIGGQNQASPFGLFRLEWNSKRLTQTQLRSNDNNLFELRQYQLEPDSLPRHNEVFALHIDKNEHLWIGTALALHSADLSATNTPFKAHNEFLISDNLPYSGVFSILPEGGKLWLGRAGTIQSYDPVKNVWGGGVPPQTNQLWAGELNLDQQGRFWFTDRWGGGLYIIEKDSISTQTLPLSPIVKAVNTVLADRSNVIWMGKTSSGLYKFSSGFNQFNPMKGMFTERKEVYINGLHEDKLGRLWVNNHVVNRQTGQWVKPPIIATRFSQFLYVTVDKKGIFWAMPKIGQLWSYNPETTQEHLFDLNKTAISDGPVYADSTGILWWGGHGKIHRFDPGSSLLKSFLYNSNAISNRVGKFNSILTHGQSGYLWIGTQIGLVRFNEKDETFKTFRHDPEDPKSLSADRVLSVLDDPLEPTRYLWVGTEGGGLNRLDKLSGLSERITLSDGLPDNTIYGILADNDSNLWMSTNRGLSQYNIQKGTFRNFDVADGLQSNEFNRMAYFKSASGELFFGGVNGFNSFYPSQITDNTHIPPVVITEFRIGNHVISHKDSLSPLVQSITGTKEIRLSHEQNMISFVFAALDYTNSGKNQYIYQLEGLSDLWVQAGSNRMANFTNLDPGTYTFRVKGSNNDGLWNEEGVAVSIIIAPPWWKTWWAYTSYLLLFLAIGSTIVIIQLRRIKLRNQLIIEQKSVENIRELERAKSRFFSNITHEFRTPLTLILGPLEKLMDEDNSPGKHQALSLIKGQAEQLLQLINQLLDLSKLENKRMSVSLSHGDLHHFTQNIIKTFKPLAQQQRIQLTLESEHSPLDLDFDEEKVARVIHNLLSNALKFTPKGGKVLVTIIMLTQNGSSHIEISVRDSGPGIPENQQPYIFERFYQSDNTREHHSEGTGIGLALSKELARLMGGDIVIDSKENEGSCFTLILPYLLHQTVENQVMVKDSDYDDTQIGVPKNFSESNLPENETGNRLLILLVEDHKELRNFVSSIIGVDYEVLIGENGRQGLEMAYQRIPDLIITDVMMPEMDGHEFCNRIKNDERTSHIPVIMLTAKSALESRLRGLEDGADAYLTKPFSNRELLLRIRKLIESRKLLQEKYQQSQSLIKQSTLSPTLNRERVYLTKAEAIVEKFLDDPTFDVEAFCREMGMSRTQLHRKLRALTNESTTGFVRSVRLKTARQLLENGAGNITEVAYAVGFSSPAYFSKCFQEKFGIAPRNAQPSRQAKS